MSHCFYCDADFVSGTPCRTIGQSKRCPENSAFAALSAASARMKEPEQEVSIVPRAAGEGECRCEHCEFFEMLWAWFQERRGVADMRTNQADGGLSADDFKAMLDEHEAALISPSLVAQGIEGRMDQGEGKGSCEVLSLIRIWRECPAEKRPSAEALAARIVAALSEEDGK